MNIQLDPNFTPPKKIYGANPTLDDIYHFASEENICDALAHSFWEMNNRRYWRDSNGQKIKNWKGAFINYAKKMKGRF